MNNWLNYHHLYYFWKIAEAQSVSAAALGLSLTQPTLSAQLKQFEESIGKELFHRRGRNLVLTDDGKVVFRYASNIFALGQELQGVLSGKASGFGLKLRVGITVSLPKFFVHKTLLPAYTLDEQVHIQCYEGKAETLLSDLARHELDLVLSDTPLSAKIAIKAFNHPIGSSSVSLYATPKLIARLPKKGSERFHGAPFILPTRNTMLRREMDRWFEREGIEPQIVAEFEDSVLLKSFASEGLGVIPVASVVEREVEEHYPLKRAAKIKDLRENFYAISLRRKVTHPAIVAITRAAVRSFR